MEAASDTFIEKLIGGINLLAQVLLCFDTNIHSA